MTGATNGMGRLAALDLARRGARLGVVARSRPKADALRQEIEQVAPGTPIDVFRADLSLLAEVRRAGEEIAAHCPRIDVLINNAGLHAFSRRVTSEGYAEMTAVNYLAPWVLTDVLRDRLTASAPARIVTVGFNATGLGREIPLAGALARALTALSIGNPQHGADIIVKLATDPGFADSTGGYFAARTAKPLQCPEIGRGEAIQCALWEATAELVNDVHDARRPHNA
ncbi:SDR family NAD(P)-dependent oxidoreductase [Streptomyces olivochromogenes]|uniref:SDR family NAD(P)-dependent oxidoreductase n=1 Tax=Streptomyces olivochromogenes TaxID=1963 RepID=UPI0036C37B0C